MNNASMFLNSTGAPRESIHETKYRDRPRCSLSQVSFYKPTTVGASRIVNSKKNVDQRNIPPELIKKEGMKILMRFLSWQEYPDAISMADLQSPSRSLLISLWDFILKRVDKSIEIDTKNANEEVPRIFKELGYPLTISKSSMVAPGTGQQWSHHLAALCWLCELLIYETEAFPNIADNLDFISNETGASSLAVAGQSLYGGPPIHLSFDKPVNPISASTACLNRIVAKNYMLCMTGRETKESIKNAVLSQLEMDVETMRSNFDRKMNDWKALQAHIEEIKTVLNDHHLLGPRIATMKEEYTKMQSLYNETKNQIPVVEKQVEEAEQSLRERMAEYDGELANVQQLEEIVANQSMNKEEVQQLNQTVQASREALRKHTEDLESCKKERADKEALINHETQEILPLCPRLNRLISECLELVRRSKSPSLELWVQLKTFDFVSNATTLDGMLGLSWKEQKNALLFAWKADKEYLQQLNVESSLVELQNASNNVNFAAEKQQQELDKEKAEISQRHALGENKLVDLQEELKERTQAHINSTALKWSKIEEMCKNLAVTKELSREGFSRVVEEKKRSHIRYEKAIECRMP
ncbi:HEC/Ndc80p family protein [Cardiosporidium cionae]|uniref:Kinetochore protein NDC80 n=1 Tax=Cardiosporidium cionae TaxID=476202 RepID=A0ABQ7JB51_9APIC|nr:HEC/Ndc80p family protein [Cardiosporidium cionae]|eukprot:KAF8821214.1 HEC/Ndc80p family protein [Cardiosporidium cionae]